MRLGRRTVRLFTPVITTYSSRKVTEQSRANWLRSRGYRFGRAGRRTDNNFGLPNTIQRRIRVHSGRCLRMEVTYAHYFADGATMRMNAAEIGVLMAGTSFFSLLETAEPICGR